MEGGRNIIRFNQNYESTYLYSMRNNKKKSVQKGMIE